MTYQFIIDYDLHGKRYSIGQEVNQEDFSQKDWKFLTTQGIVEEIEPEETPVKRAGKPTK